jgi:hypothetical protein
MPHLHPPYSPDLAQLDFFLFEYVKHYLKGNSYPSEKALLDAVHIVLRGISRTTLKVTFRDWMKRLV